MTFTFGIQIHIVTLLHDTSTWMSQGILIEVCLEPLLPTPSTHSPPPPHHPSCFQNAHLHNLSKWQHFPHNCSLRDMEGDYHHSLSLTHCTQTGHLCGSPGPTLSPPSLPAHWPPGILSSVSFAQIIHWALFVFNLPVLQPVNAIQARSWENWAHPSEGSPCVSFPSLGNQCPV